MGKANRQKGQSDRQKQRFICYAHEEPFIGPLRFKHREAWIDWSNHNRDFHNQHKNLGVEGEYVHEDMTGKFIGGQEIVRL